LLGWHRRFLGSRSPPTPSLSPLTSPPRPSPSSLHSRLRVAHAVASVFMLFVPVKQVK
jgi:hypothetical protein